MSKLVVGGILLLLVAGSFVSGSFGQAGQLPPGYGPSVGLFPAVSYLLGAVSPTLVALTPATAAGNPPTVVTNAYVFGPLTVDDLPEDLQQRAKDLLTTIEQGFDACKKMLTTTGSYWQYMSCYALQLRTALNAAKALKQEAAARDTETSSTENGV
uniref:Uncharacterized protein n=1 Tax=Anopheles minimus TaxID=112268 RepID=A0A182W4E6_9DIPT